MIPKFYRRSLISLTVIVALSLGTVSCRQAEVPFGSSSAVIDRNLVLGNPSGATREQSNENNYLITRPQYTLSYSRKRGIPNWVAWELDRSWLGESGRSGRFLPDDELPEGWYRVKPFDYKESGFDRGHMVNSEDRSRSVEDNSATFLMTNIIPQAPDNNQGVWVQLEKYCRQLVRSGKQLYIISGGHGQGGQGERGVRATIGNGKITVPALTWKVILVLNQPGTKVDTIDKSTRSIAVIVPNKQGIKYDRWEQYITSVAEVEKLTGYKFYNNIPAEIRQVLLGKIDRVSRNAN
jgi:endonuclease G, mitochondrial